ncbi:unnamed protein product [Polarella glacialis]|uniref:EF-hand domain-containing protein n=1 Tax=Polarella glacialis TaxID=89957 RepID=A0A813IP55_POLGL|nr:unnamed protein product [Polarella glacialis]
MPSLIPRMAAPSGEGPPRNQTEAEATMKGMSATTGSRFPQHKAGDGGCHSYPTLLRGARAGKSSAGKSEATLELDTGASGCPATATASPEAHFASYTDRCNKLDERKKFSGFWTHDQDKNSSFDLEELKRFLRKGDAGIEDTEVEDLFSAMGRQKGGRVQFRAVVDFLHPPGGSFEMSSRRVGRRLQKALSRALPGPSDYAGSEQLLAGCRKAPRATIGKGPGHKALAATTGFPGPATYQDFGHDHQPSAIMGSGHGHDPNNVVSKGDQRAPGPGDYSSEVPSRVPGGYVATAYGPDTSSRSCPRSQLQVFDKNHDGNLDFGEACKLMRSGGSSIRDSEVRSMFDSVDSNKDGKISISELSAFFGSEPGQSSTQTGSRWRRKLRDTLSQSCPGPCDYVGDDRAQSRHKHAPSATFGGGPGHPTLAQASGPGPGSYLTEVSYSVHVAQRHPAATVGNGPGHLPLASLETTPGPSDYNTALSKTSRHREAYGVAIGNGPGHEGARSSHTPGPASYQCNYRRQAHILRAPAATLAIMAKARYSNHRSQKTTTNKSQQTVIWNTLRLQQLGKALGMGA